MPVQTTMSNARTASSKERKLRSTGVETPPRAGVLLQVRMWTGDDVREVRVPPLARAMVADLLSISGCEIQEESEASFTANFQDAVHAVRAARHLQRMIRGFCSASEPGCLNGCVTLSNAEEPPPSLDLGLLHQTQVLHPALPGQIILVGGLCESARLIPGLQFAPLSGGVAAPDARGRVRTVLHLLPPASGEDAADKPIAFRVTSTGTKRRVTTAELVAMSNAAAEARMAADGNAGEEAQLAAATRPAGKGPLVEEGDERKRKLPLLWIGIGGAAAAVVVGGLLLMSSPHKSAAPAATPASASIQPPVAEAPAPVALAPVAPAAVGPKLPRVSPAAQPKPVAVVAEPVAAADSGEKPLSAKERRAQEKEELAAKKKAAAEGGEGDPKAPKGGAGLISAADINYLLSTAQKDAGDGKYDKAILEFQTVLKYEPSNAAAKEGLARATRNRDSQ